MTNHNNNNRKLKFILVDAVEQIKPIFSYKHNSFHWTPYIRYFSFSFCLLQTFNWRLRSSIHSRSWTEVFIAWHPATQTSSNKSKCMCSLSRSARPRIVCDSSLFEVLSSRFVLLSLSLCPLPSPHFSLACSVAHFYFICGDASKIPLDRTKDYNHYYKIVSFVLRYVCSPISFYFCFFVSRFAFFFPPAIFVWHTSNSMLSWVLWIRFCWLLSASVSLSLVRISQMFAHFWFLFLFRNGEQKQKWVWALFSCSFSIFRVFIYLSLRSQIVHRTYSMYAKIYVSVQCSCTAYLFKCACSIVVFMVMALTKRSAQKIEFRINLHSFRFECRRRHRLQMQATHEYTLGWNAIH